MKWEIIGLFGAFAIGMSLIGAALWYQYNVRQDFKNDLIVQGIQVIQGEIASPTVIIPVTNTTEFIDMAKNKGIVYQDLNCFYILNELETIAYRYDLFGDVHQ